jgi:hypothetical protein
LLDALLERDILILNDKFEDDTNYILEHYGKKGMKWGTRSASKSLSGLTPRQRNRELNRRAKSKEKATRLKTVEKARTDVSRGGKAHRELMKAKDAHAANKKKHGTREARRILRTAKQKHYETAVVSQQAKNGKEVALTFLAAGVGALAVGALALADQ